MLYRPTLRTEIPGPASRALAARLTRVESRGVTCVDPLHWDPVFWERGEGVTIVDVDGNRFLDATSAFGVAALGHAPAAVAAAIGAQSARLVHGMGDVHPTRLKVELLERLTALCKIADARVLLASTGAEAVEGALKTARLASGKPRILALEGAYHGLTYGALGCTHRESFRAPFADQMRAGLVEFVAPTHDALDRLTGDRLSGVGAVLFEPIQGRGGIVVPAPGVIARLIELARQIGAVSIADEIFTGCGRTGRFLACEHESSDKELQVDVIVLGKALAAGIPLSAVIGRRAVMDAWPISTGEALHTSTHLGNPLGCAAALATLDTIENERLIARAAHAGLALRERLTALGRAHPTVVREVRGRGLMIGVEIAGGELALAIVRAALQRGLFLLPGGDHGEVVEILPALNAPDEALAMIVEILGLAIRDALAQR